MELIAGFKQGDRESFKIIFEQLYSRMCAYCSRYIHDQQEIEDLVQDCFITLWHKRADFDHINLIKSFLYTSVRNKSLNVIKHQTVMKTHEPQIAYEQDQFEDAEIVEEDYYGLLYNEIKQLPEGSQKIMTLALRGLKNREISEELSISKNTVKTQKKIAYAKLKERLSPSMFSWFLSF